jgi:hypothetical protein
VWWNDNIRSQGEARKKEESRDPGFLSVPDAEDLTGLEGINAAGALMLC